MKVFTVTRCTWYNDPIGAWSWNGYCDITPVGCIYEAVACGDGDLMGVTIDDADDLNNKFVDETGKELNRHARATMTEEQFREIYGSEVAGNHTVLGVPSDGIGELCEWESDCGTRFFWVTNDDCMTFGCFLTRDQMTAYLADAKYYKKHGTNMPSRWENKEHLAYLRKKGA